MRAEGGTLVPLHIGDTHRTPPADALFGRAVGDDKDDALYRYGATAGLVELREAIATRARDLYGIPNVTGAQHVHLGSGGTHALFCAARAVLDAGDDVLVAAPYWPLSVGIFHACMARPVEVPLTSRLYEDPSLDAGALFAAAITPRTKALYLISPNNPDGKVLGRACAARSRSLRVAIENDLWVFSDEVYADLTFDAPHVSVASLPGMAERTIVVQSLSKSQLRSPARGSAAVIAARER